MQFLGPNNTPHIFNLSPWVLFACSVDLMPNCFLCKNKHTRTSSIGTPAQGYISSPPSVLASRFQEAFPKGSFLLAKPSPQYWFCKILPEQQSFNDKTWIQIEVGLHHHSTPSGLTLVKSDCHEHTREYLPTCEHLCVKSRSDCLRRFISSNGWLHFPFLP